MQIKLEISYLVKLTYPNFGRHLTHWDKMWPGAAIIHLTMDVSDKYNEKK